MDDLFTPLRKLNFFPRLQADIRNHVSPIAVFGLGDSQKSHLIATSASGRSILFVTSSDARAERAASELESLLGRRVVTFGADNGILYRRGASSTEEESGRIGVLSALRAGEVDCVACSAEALMRPLVPAALFDENALLGLTVGAALSQESLIASLVALGYEREASAEESGRFAVRGGMVDLVTPQMPDAGVRIEFFGDEIDSLRRYDPQTQRSTGNLETLDLYPAREMLYTPAAAERAHAAMSRAVTELFKNYTADDAVEKKARFTADLMALRDGRPEKYEFPLLCRDRVILTDYFRESPLVVIDEPKAVSDRSDSMRDDFAESLRSMLERAEALPAFADNLLSPQAVFSALGRCEMLLLQTFSGALRGFDEPAAVYNVAARSVQSFYGNTALFFDELRSLLDTGSTVALCLSTAAKADRMRASLTENEIDPGRVGVFVNRLERGFVYVDAAFTVVTEQDIFIKQQYVGRGRRSARSGIPITSFAELNIGDYVVHDLQGVGIFRGVEQLEISGVKRDYVRVDYAGTDKLYIPAEHMDSIQRFIGAGETPPRINKLGGGEWNATKNRVRKAVEDMTEELSALYAARSLEKGYAFSPDTIWQRQFEDDFPYRETRDQLESIAAVKADMESPKPMDRLLCGDVGYGKTEVAIRAAFKAAMDGKQVAFLAPTTILAQQHYMTLKERLADYPVKCDVLSRFRSPTEIKHVLAALREGNVDILVGTHRLLGKDVVFKDLGLLIIDEEQRFGVRHKEKIKELKKNIDVLTMTATPIPRTLNMSLTGIRDMSLIAEAPEERYPVQTYVLDYSESLVRDAILRELHRGGQVFYVVNRVQGIEAVYHRLSELVPEADICVAHGQMPASELERVVMDFYSGKHNVLLSTTIVENGIDVPMANTLIVCDADKFGLAQLYQMRGRVGRFNRIAYAYLTVRPEKAVSETAQKRLAALRDFTDLGAGFKIAMKDLEIRGAGNIMGAEQHGHMAAVGYEMYCRIVSEAVARLKGEAAPPERRPVETTVELDIDAYIPEEYIGSQVKRIEMYKKFAAVESDEHYSDAVDELIDRFGEPPRCVMNLLDVAYLKNLAVRAGIASVTFKAPRDLVCVFDKAFVPEDMQLFFDALVRHTEDGLVFSPQTPPRLTVRGRKGDAVTDLEKRLIAFLKDCRQ
ncbi:MAG: transcription-repair coupling factor [Eubacteriales bacterium]|nr:transcription-repair coupling factor [Eubacteriales bacterium]